MPVYQVRLDWLPLPRIALIRPSQLSCLVAQLVEHLPRKQYVVGLNPTRAALFSLEKEMFRLVVLPCFDLGLTVPMFEFEWGV